MKSLKSLTARLVATFLATIVVMAVIAGVGTVELTRRYFVTAERKSLLVQARVVAASCDDACVATGAPETAVDARTLPAASNVARSQSDLPSDLEPGPAQTQVLQAVLPSNFRVVAASAPAESRSPVVSRALAGVEATSVSGRKVIGAVPVVRQGQVVAAVVVEGSLDDAEAVVSDIRRQVGLALIISGLLAALVGLWSIARPIRTLTVAAQKLSRGNYDAPLPDANRPDELGALTTAFEDLRGAVQQELRARSAFVGDASHELRTPLTAMRGAVEILRSDAGKRPEVSERFLLSLHRETERMLGLVDDLLKLNHADHGSLVETEFEPIEVSAVVRSVVADMEPLAAAQHVDLTCKLDIETVRIQGNAASLRQVIVALIHNAIVHGSVPTAPTVPTSGDATSVQLTGLVGVHLSVEAGTVSDTLVVEVCDNGPGIAEPDRERVFERFTRLDAARTRQQGSGGAGLGLAIAQSLARQHGGSISFVDPPPGYLGACARITLPVLLASPMPPD
jgi:signal transduction histidine kinase